MEYDQIVNILLAAPETRAQATRGLCRPWTAEAISIVRKITRQTGVKIDVQAREVKISSLLFHSFIRIVLDTQEPYLADGTGVETHPPYFGFEKDAPPHLRNSHPDPYLNNV